MASPFIDRYRGLRNLYKDDRISLEPCVRYVFQPIEDHAIRVLERTLGKPQNRAVLHSITPEPCSDMVTTLRRSDLLQLCWSLALERKMRETDLPVNDLQRMVVSRFYSRYGGDPFWLLDLPGWTFPSMPNAIPAILGLVLLHDEDDPEEIYIYSDVQGNPRYLSASDAAELLKGRTPESTEQTIALTQEEAQELACHLHKDRNLRDKLAACVCRC